MIKEQHRARRSKGAPDSGWGSQGFWAERQDQNLNDDSSCCVETSLG